MPERFSHGWMADMSPQALEAYLEIQRRIPPERKLAMVAEMYEAMLALQTADVKARYPEASDREVWLRVTARRLGPDLMRKVYGWEADD